MSENLTYDKLQEQMRSYAVRKDEAFLTEIPTLIVLAENRLATDMKQEGFQTVVSGNLPMTSEMQKPVWWRQTISFTYVADGVVQPITLRSLEYCKNYWPAPVQKGSPRFYADYNINYFYLAATPDFQYPFELVYFARLEPLTEEHQENWLTLNAPDALLASCMYQASLWCRNDKEIAKWQGQYGETTGGRVTEDKERVVDRNTLVR